MAELEEQIKECKSSSYIREIKYCQELQEKRQECEEVNGWLAGYVRRVEELEGEVMEQLKNVEEMECEHH